MINISNTNTCYACEKIIDKAKKRYKGQKYCSTCYARIFKKRECPSCNQLARLPKYDSTAVCSECIREQPCIRCGNIGKPIGKILEKGVVCNSCSVYFRKIENCERCGAMTQKLTRVSRFKDNLRVCSKCSTRDYEVCTSCGKHRRVVNDENGKKKCKKCINEPLKKCFTCSKLIPAGKPKNCDDCYWELRLKYKTNEKSVEFESVDIASIYLEYINWLKVKVGAKKAALYLDKHANFFCMTRDFWENKKINKSDLLDHLKPSGLRKYFLVMEWLKQEKKITFGMEKQICSEQQQIHKLLSKVSDNSLQRKIIDEFLEELLKKQIKIRTIRLSIKPAVELLLIASKSGLDVPNLKSLKGYLKESPGQVASITAFINFINKKYEANINYLLLKKSKFLNKKKNEKFEKLIVQFSLKKNLESKDIRLWSKVGLRYFHNVPYHECLKIKDDMICEVVDGFVITLNNKSYWLPNVTNKRKPGSY